MKVYRHKNGNLYTIQQVGRGRTITPPRDWKEFKAVPYKTNKNAPILPSLGVNPDVEKCGFNLEFED